jgi:hypothetical protein
MPIKNFFLSSSLAPARSSLYLRPAYTTGMSLNCTTPDHRSTTGTSLNCNPQNSRPSSGTTLNCTFPVLDPTPGTALNCNLGHLGHLGYLGNIGNLDTLDPYPLDPTPTDSLPGAFITEMDPTDPGPSEDCYADDLLDPLHTRTLETITQATQDRLPLGSTTQVRHTPSMGTAPSQGYS